MNMTLLQSFLLWFWAGQMTGALPHLSFQGEKDERQRDL